MKASEKRVSHTPGPWKADRADMHGDEDDLDEHRWSVLVDHKTGRDYFVATIENGAPGDTLQTEEANARAIAAVPAMVEFIVEVSRNPWPDSDLSSLLQTLRARAQAILDTMVVFEEGGEDEG